MTVIILVVYNYLNWRFCLHSTLFTFHLVFTQDYQVIDKVWIIKDKHGPEAWEPDEGETIDVAKVSELHVTSVEWLSYIIRNSYNEFPEHIYKTNPSKTI